MQAGLHEGLQVPGIPVRCTPVCPEATEVGGAAPSSGVGTLTPLPTLLLTQTLGKEKESGRSPAPLPQGPPGHLIARSRDHFPSEQVPGSTGLTPASPCKLHPCPARSRDHGEAGASPCREPGPVFSQPGL